MSQDEKINNAVPKASPGRRTRVLGFLPIPRRLQHDPLRPIHFGLLLNAIFGVTSTFVMANLYYSQLLLIRLSQSFNVTYDDISRVPTLVQGGYGTGLLFISPLGDLVRRRQLLLIVVALGCLISIGLATTRNLVIFEILNCFIGVVSIAPQILIPFAADLALPQRRRSAISIVLSGLLLGICISRVMSGVVAQFVSWRVVYFVAVGIQGFSFLSLWALVPDCLPSNRGLSYFANLRSMLQLALTEPTLIQAAHVHFGAAASFTAFWVTLTFLLGANPYNYDTIVIGLFGLIGMIGVFMAPLYGHAIDQISPWYVSLASTTLLLATKALYLGAAGLNIAVPILVTVGLDIARQSQQVALATRVFAIEDGMRARLNAVCIFAIFLSQVIGSPVGSKVFLHGGWRGNGALMVGLCAMQLAVHVVRGPHAGRYTWFGYEGGFDWRPPHRKADAEGAVIVSGSEEDGMKMKRRRTARPRGNRRGFRRQDLRTR